MEYAPREGIGSRLAFQDATGNVSQLTYVGLATVTRIWLAYYGSRHRTIDTIGELIVRPFLYGLCTGRRNLARI